MFQKNKVVSKNWAYLMCKRETRSQPMADIFPFLLGGGQNLVKLWRMSCKTNTDQPFSNIVLIGDKVVGKAIANRTCIRNEWKLGAWGLAPRKIFEATSFTLA